MPLKSAIFIIITALFAAISAQPPVPPPYAIDDSAAEEAATVASDSAKIAAVDTGTTAVPDSANPYLSVKPPSERMKYVAVVETDIDEHSGAAAELTHASAKLVRNDGSLYTFNGKDGRQHMSSDLNELWLRFGAGADIDINRNVYMRGEGRSVRCVMDD